MGIIPPSDLEHEQSNSSIHDQRISKAAPKGDQDRDISDLSILRYFLKQVNILPPLTEDQEREISLKVIRIQKRRAELRAQQDRTPNPLPIESSEIDYLQDQISQLVNRLVVSHLRLVINIAKRYQNMGLSFVDLINEGTIGLISAAHRFNPEKNCRFSTYATWWVRQSITKALGNKSRLIRIPLYLQNQIRKYAKLNTTEEPYSSISEDDTSPQQKNGEDDHPFPDYINYMNIQSLDTLASSLGSDRMILVKPEQRAQTICPYEIAKQAALERLIEKALEQLDIRERLILKLRFGLTDYGFLTLEETGSVMGLTRERVRQIQHQALEKIRSLKEGSALRDFLEGED